MTSVRAAMIFAVFGILGFYDFYLVFIYDIFIGWFLLNIYTPMCLYLQCSTLRMYVAGPIPHILIVVIFGYQGM